MSRAEARSGLRPVARLGFTFRGRASCAVDIGTHLDVGAVQVDSLRLALNRRSARIPLETGAVLKFDPRSDEGGRREHWHPLRAAIPPGNVGPADLDVSFMPPNGVGLSLDAGGFKGGGFLRFDAARGEYGGALELDFMAPFSVKAIGIITTKMPDGSKGFSLLIIITVEFGTGIQLGFGFTLLGVGGLIGLNRTMNLQALADGIRTGAIESRDVPAGHHRQRAQDHQRPAHVLPAA